MKKILLLSALIIAGILFTSQIKRACLSLVILIDVIRAPEQAVLGRLVGGPTVTKVKVPGRDRVILADLYRSHKEGKLFPLLLVHGLNPTGKDDEQLVLLAKDLARAGFLVMVPEFEGMKTLRIRTSDAEDILRSFLYLSKAKQTAFRGGMMGLGYGAGPMLLAAADARIRDKVGVVATFGGYYDLRTVMLFSLTGAYEYGGLRGHIRPDAALRWMFAYKNLDLLRSLPDRETLRAVIEKRNRYELVEAEKLAQSLGREGRALYDFLVNTEQKRFAQLYEKLPLTVREQVYQLSPSRAVDYITGSFIIAHGTDDSSIPYTESQRLADAVSDKNRAHLALLPRFMHDEPLEISAGDWFKRHVLGGWRLYGAIYDLLEKGGIH